MPTQMMPAAIQVPIHRSKMYGARSLAASGRPTRWSWATVSAEQPASPTSPTIETASNARRN